MRLWILLTVLPAMLTWQMGVGHALEGECVSRTYKVISLPLIPSGINDSAEVVGTSSSHQAALWTKQGGLREIGTLPGFTSSEGIAVNQQGTVIAIAVDLKHHSRQGFYQRDGKLRPLPGNNTTPLAINSAGLIVGEATVNGKAATSPVVWKGSTMVDLGGCCGGISVAVNQLGQVAGNIYDRDGRYQAFLWDEERGLQYVGPANVFSAAVGLNDAGTVVVQSFSSGTWLYENDILQRLELSPKGSNHPKAINNCGIVVGSFGGFHDYYRAFIWDQVMGFRDLNSLIGSGSGWKLQEATAINDFGEIVGWGEHGGHDEAGFLLVPER